MEGIPLTALTPWGAILFMVILSLGIATLTLDLIYPLIDPRITYREA